MTRREMFKSVLIFGAGLTIPTTVKSFVHTRKPVKMIGIGWKGCQTADYFSKNNVKAEYIHINDSFGIDKCVYSADKIYNLDYPEVLYNCINERSEEPKILSNEIKSIFNVNYRYVVAVKAGEKTSTKIALAIISYLNEMKYEYFTIVYLPYGFEGSEKDKRARSVVSAIDKPEMSYINDMRCATRKYGKLTLEEVTRVLNQNVLKYYLQNVY